MKAGAPPETRRALWPFQRSSPPVLTLPITDASPSKPKEVIMKKTAVKEFEASALVSNLLLAGAVLAAAAPFLLGDRLVFIASSAVRECTVLFQSISISLQRLLS